MKMRFILLAAIVATANLQAIPDNFGSFINPAGMRLENFVNRAAAWQPNADIKGNWGMWNDPQVDDLSVEVQRLQMSAIVFGVEANLVTMQKRDNQPIRFDVHYKTSSGDREKATRQLIANINAWSGGSLSLENPSLEYEHVRVRLINSDENAIQVSLEPLTS